MKLRLILSLLLFSIFQVNAQFKMIAQGPVFKEPEKGFSKILQLKNGSTMFFHITYFDGIEVKIYDAAHKQKVVKRIDPAYGELIPPLYGGLKSGNVDGIFEINNDAVLMVSKVDAKIPVLYRLIIDGKTGALKEEKKIAELKRLSAGQGYAMGWGGVPPPDFFVRKDPYSENYAIAMFNTFESDRNKRIEIVFYGSDNKELSRAYYGSGENKYKYLQYIDMAVIGKEKVSVLAYAYNTKRSGGEESKLLLATVNAGNPSVTLDELDFSKDLEIDGGITRYNPITKKIILLVAAKRKKNEYEAHLALIDPFERTIRNPTLIYPSDANVKSMELFGNRNKFTGLPQNLFINKDGSFSIVYEEIKVTGHTSSSGTVVYTTELGHIAVSRFDTYGLEKASYFIPKNHRLPYSYLNPFYHSEREGSAQLLGGGNQFKSFAYLNGNDKIFVLFNDVERNAESVLNGKLTSITGVGDCHGFSFNVGGNDIMPHRNYVFGRPESKRENNLALFAISDYNRDTNVYVTLKLEKEGREKGVSLVWMQPQ